MEEKKLFRQFLIANCSGKKRKFRKLLSIIKKKVNEKVSKRSKQRNKSDG